MLKPKNHPDPTLTGLLTAQLLLGTICLVHLFAIISYLLNVQVSPGLFPAAVLIAIGLSFLLADQLKTDKRLLLRATVVSLLVLAISLITANFYFDFSWDGQWYHQAAVYNLGGKWNPIFQPMETPDHVNNTSILYFPKNSWVFGAALLRTFGTVEVGKAYNIILVFTGFGIVYALCRSFKLSALRATLLTLLILLNPVVWSELTTYLNDADLYLLLVIYIASFVLWLRNPKSIFIVLGAMAVICLVNTKFTGLVFFLVTSFFVFVYILIKEKTRIKSFLLAHVLIGIIAVFIFGFNPYVTNMLNRGNPLYPLMGSKAFPSVFETKGDSNEKNETPHNMQGKSLPVRLFYANFSQPGNAPYNKEVDAKLAWPSITDTASWKTYDFQDPRVSAFGPYFGVLLVLMFIGLPVILIAFKQLRLPALLFLIGLCCCLSLSKHFWWPRFFPMLWLAPILPLFLLWADDGVNLIKQKANGLIKAAKIYAWLLVVIIGINSLIVGFIHIQWETVSTITLRTQLEQLRDQKRPIEVFYGAFDRSIPEKLKHWDIKYTSVPTKHSIKKSHKLMSVVKGYPNTVLYRQE